MRATSSPMRVKGDPSASRAWDIIMPGEDWQLVAEGFKSTRGPACLANGEVFCANTSNNKTHRIGLDGQVSVFVEDAGQAHCVAIGADGTLFTLSERSGKLMRYDASGQGSVVMEGVPGHSILATPSGGRHAALTAVSSASGLTLKRQRFVDLSHRFVILPPSWSP